MSTLTLDAYKSVIKEPARRDPRAYIITSNQSDFPTVTKFVNTLRNIGDEVNQATAAFTEAGKNYPAGAYAEDMDMTSRV